MTARSMRPKIRMGRIAARAGVRAYATAAATMDLTPRIVIRLAAVYVIRLARTSPASPRRIWIRSRKPSRARARGRMRWRVS